MNTGPSTAVRSLGALSVSRKIALGFATVLVLHVSIAIMGHHGLQRAEQDRHRQDAILSQVKVYYEIDRVLGDLQRSVLLFSSTGYDGPRARAELLQDDLERLLNQALGMSVSEADQAALLQMRDHLDSYQEIFAAVVTDRDKRRKLIDQDLMQHGEGYSSSLRAVLSHEGDDGHALTALSEFRSAQLLAMQFVHSPDSLYVRGTKQHLERAQGHLIALQNASAKPSSESIAAALAQLSEYRSAFIQMVQATRGYLHLVNVVLAGQATEFAHLTSVAREEQSEKAVLLSAKMGQDSEIYQTASNVFSVITIVLGIVASWLIGRDVAPRLNAIAKTFDRLARGEQCEAIPGLERHDELGRLASAAQVFKEKAAETERLLHEVKHLQALEQQLSQAKKLEALGQLAAGIAHEINTPMQCVVNNVEYLEKAHQRLSEAFDRCQSLLDGAGTPDAKDWAEIKGALDDSSFRDTREQTQGAIDEASDALKRIIEIVRAMKTMAHPGTTRKTEADVNELVRSASTISRNRWRELAELQLDLDESLPPILALPAELSQVFLNLIVNAGDAIEERHGDSGTKGEIQIRTAVIDSCIKVEIEDNGAGMPAEVREKVFDPFYTTKEVGKGTGQGLAITYDIVVNKHGGSIDVLSTPGEGTTIVLWIPLEQDASGAAEPERLTSRS